VEVTPVAARRVIRLGETRERLGSVDWFSANSSSTIEPNSHGNQTVISKVMWGRDVDIYSAGMGWLILIWRELVPKTKSAS
jgi:hypothetical protein